jgi:DNA-binding response OmpR family regulator
MNKILVMSNDPIFRRKNLEVLSSAGFIVTDVSDAFDGLIRVGRDGFSIIIIDEELADIDGYLAFAKIRQYSGAPMILLGTESSEDIWAKIKKQELDVYLKKPVSPNELLSRVKSIMRSASYEEKPKPAQIGEIPAESTVAEKVTHAFSASSETSQRIVVPAQAESIELMIAGLEQHVTDIRTAIGSIGQLRKIVEDAKTTIHQQLQDMKIVENQLQEVSDQLKNFLGDFKSP